MAVVHECSGHLGIDRTVLTYVLDDLVAVGLIERQPDPADRRVRRLALTDRGVEPLADLERDVLQAVERLLAGMTDDERALLHRSRGPRQPASTVLIRKATRAQS